MFYPSVVSDEQAVVNRGYSKIEPTTSDILLASMSLGRTESVGGKLDQIDELEKFKQESTTIVPMEEANKMVPNMEVPFDSDVTMGEVEYQRSKLFQKEENNKIISRAGDSFWKGTALPFVGRAMGAFMDPVDFSIGAVAGWGIGAGLTKLAAGSSSKAVALLANQGLGRTMAEAFAGNVAAEVTVSQLSKTTRDDYTMQQAFLNATIGTIAMTGIMHGATKGLARMKNVSSDFMAKRFQVTEELTVAGKDPIHFNRIIEKDLDELDAVTPEFESRVRQYYPEQADELLEGGSAIEIMNTLKNTEEFAPMVRDLEEAGDVRYRLANESVEEVLPDRTEEFREIYDRPESDLDYDPEIENLDRAIPENYDGTQVDTELQLRVQEAETRLKEMADSGDVEAKKALEQVQKEAEISESRILDLEEYAKCKAGL